MKREDAAPVLTCALAAAAALGWGAVRALGFYHDDWPVLAFLEEGARGTGSFRALMEAFPSLIHRPLDPVLWWAEHALFGLRPLGWHLTQGALLAAAAHQLAALARDRGASARTAVAAAVLFVAWPCKDAAQNWPVVTTVLCSGLAWLACERLRRAYESGGDGRMAAGSALAFLAGLCFYEQILFLPLSWLLDPPAPEAARARRRRAAALLGAAAAAWLLLRLGAPALLGIAYPRAVSLSPRHLMETYLNLRRAHGPPVFRAVVRELAAQFRASPAGVAAALTVPFLCLLAPKEAGAGRDRPAYGLAVFALGYLPIALSEYLPVPLGPENRVNLIPTLGLALAAAAWWDRRPRPAAAAAAALVATGLLLAAAGGAAGTWVESSRRQEAVLAAVRARLADWPPDRRLILRLPENFVGERAPVFVSHDSLTYFLRLRLGDPVRAADVVRADGRFTPEGFLQDGTMTPYARLAVFDAGTGSFVGAPPAGM